MDSFRDWSSGRGLGWTGRPTRPVEVFVTVERLRVERLRVERRRVVRRRELESMIFGEECKVVCCGRVGNGGLLWERFCKAVGREGGGY